MNSESNTSSSVGRNEPCPCGSGKKYKRCHGINAAPKLTLPSAPAGGGAAGGENPYEALSNLDPQTMAQFAQVMQRLPRGQLQRLQGLMQKAMAGKDVTREAQEFERSLPPDFMELVKGMNLPGALDGQMGMEAPATEVAETSPAADDLSEDQAKAIVETAVAEGRLSHEEAQKLLGSPATEAPTPATTASRDGAGISKFWKKLGGKKT
ncbi:MAG: SEC-C domain-containing protein [Oligoflexia bacterium]|nr:SEC-C domain-containing protein [Oligoflexia bacterium]